MIALHAPDGFFGPNVALVTALISGLIVVVSLRQSSHELSDRQVPLAGVAAAFIFAAQMLNFPIAAGTSGHLIGGALVAILLGPWAGVLVMSIVIAVQAFVFADGGITALGYNTLNMAIVTAFAGWALFQLFLRLLPANRSGLMAATALAAGSSVVLSAAAFSLEWLFGASAPIPFDLVFGAMVGAHLLVGIGEGIVSSLIVGAVVASRPDLVAGARHLNLEELGGPAKVQGRVLIIAGVIVALCGAAIGSQFSDRAPDQLEKLAIEHGIDSESGGLVGQSLFSDYATSGIGNEAMSLAIAGATGVIMTLLVGYGLLSAYRRTRVALRAS